MKGLRDGLLNFPFNPTFHFDGVWSVSGSRLQGLSGWRCGDRVNHLQLCKLVAERNPPPKPTHPHTYTTTQLLPTTIWAYIVIMCNCFYYNCFYYYCYYCCILLNCAMLSIYPCTGLNHGMACSVSFLDIRKLHIFIAVSLTKCVVICCQVIW